MPRKPPGGKVAPCPPCRSRGLDFLSRRADFALRGGGRDLRPASDSSRLGSRARSTSLGFSLIEAVVAISVVVILAGMLAPLFLKTANQQREQRTREAARLAFEGLFGAKDRRVANLRSDIGFNPTASLADLSILTVKGGSGGSWSGVRDYGIDTTYGLSWGYNGPYWNGSVRSNMPLDGWGRPLRLVVAGASPNQTWQVLSVGANGAYQAGAGDDIAYPIVPAKALAFSSVVNVTITYNNYQSGSVSAYSRNPTGASLVAQNYFIPPNITGASPWTWTNQLSPPTLSYSIPAGGVVLTVTVGGSSTTHLLDLLPGEARDFTVNL